jgi:hypothetical protein
MVDDCWFSFLKGTAIKIGRVTVCRVNFGRIYQCGNTDRPAIHLDGLGGFGGLNMFGHVVEGTHLAPSLKINAGTAGIIQRTHFESNDTTPELQQTFVHCSSTCTLLDNIFGALGCNVTQVIYDGTGNFFPQLITRNDFKGLGTALVIGGVYQQVDISGNQFIGSGATANVDSVTINGSICKLFNNRFNGAGRINLVGDRTEFNNNSLINGIAPSGSAWVVIGGYGQINNNFFDGVGTFAQTAIKPIAGNCRIHDNYIRGLNNVTAIDVSGAELSSVQGNYFVDLTGGQAIVPRADTLLRDNYGYPDQLVYSSTVPSASVTNTVIETTFDQFYTIPANRLRAGDLIRVRAQGIVTSSNATDTLDIHLEIGGQQVLATGAVDVSNSDIFVIDAVATIRATGMPGTMVAAGWVALGTEGMVTAKAGKLVGGSINTTIARDVFVSATWSAASAANSVRLDLFTVEILSPGR